MAEGAVTESSDAETFHRVLGRAVETLEEAGIAHVVFGSVAIGIYGRSGPSGDIDLLIRPADQSRALAALDRAGFRVDETDQTWISKAFLDGVMVDLIVQMRGDLFLDDDMLQRARRVEIHGNEVQLVSPEDAVLIEAASNAPEIESHWYQAVSIVIGTELDWAHLMSRARLAPRRVLSLLVYADADDIEVPRDAIRALYERVYSDEPSDSIASSR
jgi:predicted nucleotidyltransferase